MTSKQTEPPLSRSHVVTIAFFTIFLFLLYQMASMLAVFSAALIWAGIIALALHPLYRKMVTLLRGRTGMSATVMTLVILPLIINPALALLAVLVSQAIDLYQWASEGVKSSTAAELWNRLASYVSQTILFVTLLTAFIQIYREEYTANENRKLKVRKIKVNTWLHHIFPIFNLSLRSASAAS